VDASEASRRKLNVVSAVTRLVDLGARAVQRAWYGVGTWTAIVWVGALSLVGIEAFEVIFGVGMMAPEFVPVVVLVLATVFFVRRFIRRRTGRADDEIAADVESAD
jgi:TRAP-type C4-dicarboxylate transport system permease small subunit